MPRSPLILLAVAIPCWVASGQTTSSDAPTATNAPAKFRSSEDGWMRFGFRYELARKYGIHMGVDLAFAPDNTAIYIQVGSAWARP